MTTQGFNLKAYPKQLRPREKMELLGAEHLTDAELLAILLNTGNREQNVLELAESFLRNVGGMHRLHEASLTEMQEQKGIGPAKATIVMAAVELGKRMLAGRQNYEPPVSSSSMAAEKLIPYLAQKDRECFMIMLLNHQHVIIGVETVSVGTLSNSPVHPREVFKPAVKKSAAAVILAHNHPSGNLSPSREDYAVTRRLVEAGKLMGIEVLDHIIVAGNMYYSFKEQDDM